MFWSMSSKIDSSTLKTHILIYNMPKTSKLTQKISLQLEECWSECSDSRFDFKNGFYDPENPYFDIKHAQNIEVGPKN